MRVSTAIPFVAVVLLLAAAAPAWAGEVESFSGTVLLTSNMRMPPGRTYQVTLNVETWTPVEDRQRVLVALKEGGEDAALKELEKMKAGYVVPPAWANQPTWRVAIATKFETATGTVVRVVTDRPIAFLEAYRATRSRDYRFGVAEFKLDEKGTGEGVVIPAARIEFDEEGKLVIETLPHSTGPQKLIGVKAWGWDKKKE
jgi:hypothetical protein